MLEDGTPPPPQITIRTCDSIACELAGAQDLIKAGQPLVIDSGHIALQAEGQGVWFRNIEIKLLEPCER